SSPCTGTEARVSVRQNRRWPPRDSGTMSPLHQRILVANAPVSYGAFELTVGIDPNVPDAEMVLEEVSAAGYAGIDLGPVGYLGDEDGLGGALAAHGLLLSGGFFELPFSDPSAMPAAIVGLAQLLDVFDAVSSPPR